MTSRVEGAGVMRRTSIPIWIGIFLVASWSTCAAPTRTDTDVAPKDQQDGAVMKVAAERSVRSSALAGVWYPEDAGDLALFVDSALAAARAEPTRGEIRALIVPHAGYRYSGATAAEVFSLVQGLSYRRVVLLAPSHRSGFHGLSIADVNAYETPLGLAPLDQDAIGRLRRSDLVTADPVAHDREHSIEIELPMLQRALAPGWQLIPVLVGRLDDADYPVAANLLRPLMDEETLVVVSSDFTHYGPRFRYLPFPLDAQTPARIRALDDGAVSLILAGDASGLLEYQEGTGITICGLRPLALLLHLLPQTAEIEQVAYATSGGLTGDYGNSVSYVALVVTASQPISAALTGTPDADLRLLHRLAVRGVEEAVLGRPASGEGGIERALGDLPARFLEPSGAFVTLKRGGRLRGCIGYIQPRQPLYQAVLENGVNAARNDRRFAPVSPAELADLEVEVSVLSVPEPIDSYEQFRVGEQGIILRKDGRKAVFLPEVAREQGWTRDETLRHLARKAGLPDDAWQEGASLEVFTSSKFSAPFSNVDESDPGD